MRDDPGFRTSFAAADRRFGRVLADADPGVCLPRPGHVAGYCGGSRPSEAQLQEGAGTGRVTFLQGNSSGCYVSVTALAYRAQSVTNEIRQRRPIFFLIFFSPPFRPRSCENFMILNYPYFFFFLRLVLNSTRGRSRGTENPPKHEMEKLTRSQ